MRETTPGTNQKFIDIGTFRRMNIFSEPWKKDTGVASITLNLYLTTSTSEDVILVRLRDPVAPARIWSHAEVKVSGFNTPEPSLMSLTLDMTDLVLGTNDRLWMDVCSAIGVTIVVEDENKPSHLSIRTIPVKKALAEYTPKEIYAAKTEFSVNHRYPMSRANIHPDFRTPMAFSGEFDTVYPVQAVRRFDPNYPEAKYIHNLVTAPEFLTDKDRTGPFYSVPGVPGDVPAWAMYMRTYIKLRTYVSHYWADHQNPDGQFGGGWNDDTPFLVNACLDLPLDGDMKLLSAMNKCRDGFDKTGIYRDGYQHLYPMDRLHTGDVVNKCYYNVVLMNLGGAKQMEYAFDLSWHEGHPERTPMHYSQNWPFGPAKEVVMWYWNRHEPLKPFIGPDEKTLTDNLKSWIIQNDSTSVWYATGAYKEMGGPSIAGTQGFHDVFLGGSNRLGLAVSWPKGGGEDVARWVEYADDTSFKARIFSFDDTDRTLSAQFYRLKNGMYTVSIAHDTDNDGKPDKISEKRIVELRRFSAIDVTLPPQVPVLLTVELVEKHEAPGPLPDFAVDPRDIRVSSTFVTVTVHNIGDAPARNVSVKLLVDGREFETKTIDFIDTPTDFVPKFYSFQFDYRSGGEIVEAYVDHENAVEEIYEYNNHAVSADYRGDDYFEWTDIPYVP